MQTNVASGEAVAKTALHRMWNKRRGFFFYGANQGPVQDCACPAGLVHFFVKRMRPGLITAHLLYTKELIQKGYYNRGDL